MNSVMKAKKPTREASKSLTVQACPVPPHQHEAKKVPYLKPLIISVEKLEVIASICDVLSGGKSPGTPFCTNLHS